MPRCFELGLLSFGQGYEIELWIYFKAQPPYLLPYYYYYYYYYYYRVGACIEAVNQFQETSSCLKDESFFNYHIYDLSLYTIRLRWRRSHRQSIVLLITLTGNCRDLNLLTKMS